LGAVNHNNAAESQTNLLEGSERDPFSLIFIFIILFFLIETQNKETEETKR